MITQQKILFMEIITEKLKETKQSDLMSIHRKVCASITPKRVVPSHNDAPKSTSTTPKRALFQNIDRICSDSNDEDQRKRMKTTATVNSIWIDSDDEDQRKHTKTTATMNHIYFSDSDDEDQRKHMKTTETTFSTTKTTVRLTSFDVSCGLSLVDSKKTLTMTMMTVKIRRQPQRPQRPQRTLRHQDAVKKRQQ